jgi:recombination protein RecT
MSTSLLKSAVTGSNLAQRRRNDVSALLNDPKVKAQIALALPRHITADRLARVALTEIRRTPALARCDPASLLGAIMTCAQLGLEPGGPLGHAYLVPFENRRAGRTDVQFILGYRGMIDLARRSGQIQSIEARAVYEGDQFDVKFGLDSDLTHVPDFDNPNRAQPDKLRFVYAVAKLKDGGVQFEVLSRREVEAVRAQSKAGSSGPWQTHYEAMALKTVIWRLCRYLPISIEMATAVEQDERADHGEPQESPFVVSDAIDVEARDLAHEAPAQSASKPQTKPEPTVDLIEQPRGDDIEEAQ